ncbi:hypothetical protein AmaxDRAFT_2818 [Limnospira maxima CS-328]|uniref:Uncharacterized protein n=2 Tax=Limnospira TaxID=2596745 RepID=A0A9P1KL45_9CYAN|nr:hypothetical protein AmaxDRAFT_2818 [Limnospira maxima CS-328]UWU45525.1 hypothetical protein APLC1_0205 [Arthrospira platensis C1]CDM98477.1 conserved protein of unknown function [Limnospira indica PCC 8005]
MTGLELIIFIFGPFISFSLACLLVSNQREFGTEPDTNKY